VALLYVMEASAVQDLQISSRHHNQHCRQMGMQLAQNRPIGHIDPF